MKISRKDLDRAVNDGIISHDQAGLLWETLNSLHADKPRFDLPHVLYYFGALIVISAMGWFMTEAWEEFGGGGIFIIATTYAACFLLAGRIIWYKEGLRIPGGLLFTVAVCMTPLAVYGLERLTGIWPQGNPGIYRDYHIWVKGSWFLMELATILIALVVLKYIRFPFLMAPIAFSLWYMSMDLTPLLYGKTEFIWDERLWVSLWFGLGVLLAAYVMDRRTKDDYAFWLYLFGMMAFWGGLSLMKSDSELNKFLYCVINLGLMMISILIRRRVFIIFGSMGVFGYIGHLSYRVFEDSIMFPFVLTLIGILVIYLGIKYQRNRDNWEKTILERIPEIILRLSPIERIK